MTMRILLSFIFVLMFLLTSTSCDNQHNRLSLEADEPDVYEINRSTVILPMVNSVDQSTNIEYLNTILSNAGVNVTFELYTETLTESYADNYVNYIKANIDNDCIYIVTSTMLDALIDELHETHFDSLKEHAPSYTEKLFAMFPSDSFASPPVGYSLKSSGVVSVLIRSEDYHAYGSSITSIDEYQEYLTYMLTNSAKKPALFAPVIFDRFGQDVGYMALSLFLPSYGYSPVDTSDISDRDLLGLYFDQQRNSIMPAYAIQESRLALKELLSWNREQLIDIWQPRSGPTAINFDDYSSIIVNSSIIYDNKLAVLYPEFNAVDFGDYVMITLHPEVDYYSVTGSAYDVTAYAIIGSKANASELYHLLEWMCDRANYRMVMHGIEGVDYLLNEKGVVETIDTTIDYSPLDQLFFISRVDMLLDNLSKPENMAALPEKKGLISNKDDLDEIIYTLNSQRQIYNEISDEYNTFMRTVFSENSNVDDLFIDSFFETLERDDKLEHTVRILSEVTDE